MPQNLTEEISADYLDQVIEREEILNYKGANSAYIDALQAAKSFDHIFGKGDNSHTQLFDIIKENIKPFRRRDNNTQIIVHPTSPPPPPPPSFSPVKAALLGGAIALGPVAGYVASSLLTPTPAPAQVEQVDQEDIEVF